MVCRQCWASFINRRQLAFVIDMIIWLGCSAGLERAFEWARLPRELANLLSLLFLFRDAAGGISPGKWLLDLRVVDRNTLEPIGPIASLKRNIMIAIPRIWVLSALLIGFTMSRGPRWGDGWARTMVIRRKYAHRLPFDTRGRCCQECGYDLTGNNSGICPECGTAIPPQRKHLAGEQPSDCQWCGESRMAWQFTRIYDTPMCMSCLRRLVQRREAAFAIDAGLLVFGWWSCAQWSLLGSRSFWSVPAHVSGLVLFSAMALRDSLWGCSPGKFVMGLRVLRIPNGRRAGPLSSFMRSVSWFWPFPLMTVVYAAGARYELLDEALFVLWGAVFTALSAGVTGLMKGQRWGDRLASTCVVPLRRVAQFVQLRASTPQALAEVAEPAPAEGPNQNP